MNNVDRNQDLFNDLNLSLHNLVSKQFRKGGKTDFEVEFSLPFNTKIRVISTQTKNDTFEEKFIKRRDEIREDILNCLDERMRKKYLLLLSLYEELFDGV